MASDDDRGDRGAGRLPGHQTNTGGGDYVEGNARQEGAFVRGGTIHGNVIGRQILQQLPSLPPALHQLRPPVGDFVGRTDEINKLVAILSAASRGPAAPICSVRGMGGLGKTELSYAIAHRLADQFPDAQLFIELRGAERNALSAEQALQTAIRAFEPEQRLPDELSELQKRYRSLLAGKRALIVADDAKDAAQVRELVPPRGCALLISTRFRFTLPGMHILDLLTLRPQEAEELLLSIYPYIGAHASELARLCGYLPLALRISANLLLDKNPGRITRYLEQLRAERLKSLSAPHGMEASVEGSIQLSFSALEPEAQRALCRLSVFPASFDLAAAQEVAQVAEEQLELLWRRSCWSGMSGSIATACTTWCGRSRRRGWRMPRWCGCATRGTTREWHPAPNLTCISKEMCWRGWPCSTRSARRSTRGGAGPWHTPATRMPTHC